MKNKMEGHTGGSQDFSAVNNKIIKQPVLLTGLIAMILIITYVSTLKMYEPTSMMVITGGIIVYPLSFLFTLLICRKYGFKTARHSIYKASIMYIVFILLMMICTVIKASPSTMGYNTVLQYVFVNSYFIVDGVKVFYPNLSVYLSVLVSFFASHLLVATLYHVLKNYVSQVFNVSLSLFIAYIIDRIIFTSVLFLKGLIAGNNTFEYFIKCLTSEFIGAIFATLVLVIVYAIINMFMKKDKMT